MVAAAILNLLFFVDFNHTIYFWQQPTTLLQKILLIYVNRRLSYCYCAKIQNGSRHLGFYFCSIFWHACM